MVDPEIPVLTIADLGVLRDVAIRDGQVEVAITPTYSGCPAMNMIGLEIELALEREGFRNSKVRTVLSPAWTTDWMSEDGRRKLREYGIAPPQAGGSRRALFGVRAGGVPAMRLRRYRGAVGIRLDLLQGAVALQELPRTVRLFQVSLTVTLVIASAAKQSICQRKKEWIASSFAPAMTLIGSRAKAFDVPRTPFPPPRRQRSAPRIRRRGVADLCDSRANSPTTTASLPAST